MVFLEDIYDFSDHTTTFKNYNKLKCIYKINITITLYIL